MPTGTYLASGATMGLVLVVTVLLLSGGREWQQAPERADDGGLLDWLVHDVASWRAGFVVLVVATLGGTVLALSSNSATLMLGGVLGAFVVFVAFGVYTLATNRGHPHSHAVGEAIVTLAALALVAVVAHLLLTAGP